MVRRLVVLVVLRVGVRVRDDARLLVRLLDGLLLALRAEALEAIRDPDEGRAGTLVVLIPAPTLRLRELLRVRFLA